MHVAAALLVATGFTEQAVLFGGTGFGTFAPHASYT